MTLRTKITEDIQQLSTEGLAEAYQFISLLKQNKKEKKDGWQKFIGAITKAEGESMSQTMKKEFGKIEGEW